VLVIDDFAHHPTAVHATIQAVRERWPERRIVAVFEPRSNSSRRKIFEQGYIDALALADLVFLSAPPYRHNDNAEDFMAMDTVLAQIQGRGLPAAVGPDAGALLPLLLDALRPGDLVLLMSNGGFGGLHDKLLTALSTQDQGQPKGSSVEG